MDDVDQQDLAKVVEALKRDAGRHHESFEIIRMRARAKLNFLRADRKCALLAAKNEVEGLARANFDLLEASLDMIEAGLNPSKEDRLLKRFREDIWEHMLFYFSHEDMEEFLHTEDDKWLENFVLQFIVRTFPDYMDKEEVCPLCGLPHEGHRSVFYGSTQNQKTN